jgi:hypothetical protein
MRTPYCLSVIPLYQLLNTLSNLKKLGTYITLLNPFQLCASYIHATSLCIPTVKEEICRYSSQYRARLSAHLNGLVVNLMEQPDNKTLAK